MRAEIYRLLHKKSLYIYFAALAIGYFIFAFIRSGSFNNESVLTGAMTLFPLLPAMAGGLMFAAIYTDDLNSKNLSILVGYGFGKPAIIIEKFILMAGSCLVIFLLAPLYHFAVYAILGQTVTVAAAATIFAVSVKYLLMTLAFTSLSGIVVYGTQRATFAISTYLLLSFGVIGGLVSAAAGTLAPRISEFLISGITDAVLLGITGDGLAAAPVIIYIIYVLAGLALSATAFSGKEINLSS